MIKIKFLLIMLLCLSCSSDHIVRSEKTGFYGIYKNILAKGFEPDVQEVKKKPEVYDRKWLAKFNQPIVLLSSLDGKKRATLVALGNYDNKSTWVSADGISVSFKNSILIATRGYSQDLIESNHNKIEALFGLPEENYTKINRYLNGVNQYEELHFSCSIEAKITAQSQFFDLTIPTKKFQEFCVSKDVSHTNEYYVLSGTNIVLKSKQWISETNGYVEFYNYYAFQDNPIKK